MDDLVSAGLNDEQISAINHPGSVFLTACPGSGKTKTLTFKIAEEPKKYRRIGVCCRDYLYS